MERNISDLVKQMNIVSEEHEQVLRELKNMQSVVTVSYTHLDITEFKAQATNMENSATILLVEDNEQIRA